MNLFSILHRLNSVLCTLDGQITSYCGGRVLGSMGGIDAKWWSQTGAEDVPATCCVLLQEEGSMIL